MVEPSGSEPGWLSNGERLRAGWRIALFFALFIPLSILGQLAASLVSRETIPWAGLLFSCAAAAAAGVILVTRLEGRSPGALGFAWQRGAILEVGGGMLFGSLLIAAAVAILLLTGAAYFVQDEGTLSSYLWVLLSTFIFFWIAAAWEELIFRGYPFQVLVDGIGVWPAIVVSSALFTALHGWNPNVNWLALGNIFLAGVLLALAYLRTRSLWFATAVHVGWNWAMASLFDFPVSGLTGFETPLYDVVPSGTEWWTGGAFGPEAGLVGTLVLAAGTLWLLHTRRLRVPQRMQDLRPIVDRRLGSDW
jgi:membrane protease YdiL (CAAX protease family)